MGERGGVGVGPHQKNVTLVGLVNYLKNLSVPFSRKVSCDFYETCSSFKKTAEAFLESRSGNFNILGEGGTHPDMPHYIMDNINILHVGG